MDFSFLVIKMEKEAYSPNQPRCEFGRRPIEVHYLSSVCKVGHLRRCFESEGDGLNDLFCDWLNGEIDGVNVESWRDRAGRFPPHYEVFQS
jgi:hypothetical protein